MPVPREGHKTDDDSWTTRDTYIRPETEEDPGEVVVHASTFRWIKLRIAAYNLCKCGMLFKGLLLSTSCHLVESAGIVRSLEYILLGLESYREYQRLSTVPRVGASRFPQLEGDMMSVRN
jgi:hypothetical protein